MTKEELRKPLSEIELAELFDAAKQVLTQKGFDMLRRLTFERDILRNRLCGLDELVDENTRPAHDQHETNIMTKKRS